MFSTAIIMFLKGKFDEQTVSLRLNASINVSCLTRFSIKCDFVFNTIIFILLHSSCVITSTKSTVLSCKRHVTIFTTKLVLLFELQLIFCIVFFYFLIIQ